MWRRSLEEATKSSFMMIWWFSTFAWVAWMWHFTFCLLLCQIHEYPIILKSFYLFILNWTFLQPCGQHGKSRNDIWHNDSQTVVNINNRKAWYTKHTDLQLVGCGSTLCPLPVVLDNKAFRHGAHCSVRRFVLKEWELVPLLSCNLSWETLTFLLFFILFLFISLFLS